jgi:hypothetical protein
MQVRIDEPRKNGRFAEIMNLVVLGRYLIRGDNSLDLPSFNQYGGGANSVGSDYPASDEGLQTQSVSSLSDWRLEIKGIETPPLFTMHTLPKSKQHFTSF